MTPRVLIIAYHYPPENAIGAVRPFRFCKYLRRLGYECHVITAADTDGRPELNATSIPDPSVHAPNRGTGFQIERAVRKFLLPGAMGIHWSDAAYKAGLAYIEKHAVDPVTILSTFPPVGVHVAGYRLARKTGRPWVADFRDPMAHNPINNAMRTHTRKTFAWMEKQVVGCASVVLANTDGSEAVLKRGHPAATDKIHVLWNGFDPEERVVALPLRATTRRLYTHTGELYSGRTVTPLLQSVKRLIDNGRVAPGSIAIELIGPVEPDCLPTPAFLKAAQTAGWLTVTPRQIPKVEAQLAAQTTNGLLIVQPQSAVQVPGKLYDYLQIGRPVLAYLPPESAIERVLSKGGVPYRCLYTGMPPEAMDEGMFEYLNLPSDATPASAWFEDTFNVQRQTAALAALISRIQRS